MCNSIESPGQRSMYMPLLVSITLLYFALSKKRISKHQKLLWIIKKSDNSGGPKMVNVGSEWSWEMREATREWVTASWTMLDDCITQNVNSCSIS